VENVHEGDSVQFYRWDEIIKHTSGDDKWLVINGCVYDITQWQHKHPGGARIISHFAGQDATVSFHSLVFHSKTVCINNLIS
jgi:cytochrome b involved in lipid metabolism